jgi:hypothetical protein
MTTEPEAETGLAWRAGAQVISMPVMESRGRLSAPSPGAAEFGELRFQQGQSAADGLGVAAAACSRMIRTYRYSLCERSANSLGCRSHNSTPGPYVDNAVAVLLASTSREGPLVGAVGRRFVQPSGGGANHLCSKQPSSSEVAGTTRKDHGPYRPPSPGLSYG